MKKKALFTLFYAVVTLSASAQSIHRTACQGNWGRLDSLLTHTSIEVRDDRGRTLLHWAVACEQREVFDYLIEKGITLNGEDHQKETPMHVAVRFGNEVFFDLLTQLQANQKWKNLYGTSLLTLAVLKQNPAFIKKLIEAGMDVNGRNQRGSTPLEIAQRMGAKEVASLLVSLGGDQGRVRKIEMNGPYMGQVDPGTTPQLFAPNFISTEESEFGSVFNTAGNEFYYAIDVDGKNEIRFSQRGENKWTHPTTILSHERYGYNDPFLSPAEDRLYFISTRALDGVGEVKDVDIWYVERTQNGWSEPINAGSNINSEGNEYYISFTQEGRMYFSSNVHAPEEGKGSDYDIYFAEFIDGEFQQPVPLGEAVNTEAYEADVFVSPDESYIIFCSTREDGFGRGDLYISFKQPGGTWATAVNMGDKINTHHYEYCPFVTQDGKYLFFTRNQDIYWVNTKIFKK